MVGCSLVARSGAAVLCLALLSACGLPARDADLNDDGVVDQLDVGVFIACLGAAVSDPACAAADVNGDGVIDGGDAFAMAPVLGERVCNGDAQLCARPYDQVAFPTSHNAFSGPIEKFGPFYNQDDDMGTQIEGGIRGLMLDTHYLDKNGDEILDPLTETFLCHVECTGGKKIKLVNALADIKAFLDSHPAEVITIIFEAYISAADTEAVFVESGLVDLVYTHDPEEGWPTLLEMIEAGTRVVVLTDDESPGGGPPWDPPWYHYVWSLAVETEFSVANLENFRCSDLRGVPGADLFILNHFLTLNAARPELADQTNANPFFAERAKRCWQCQRHVPNFPTVDFATTGDVIQTAHMLNDSWRAGNGAPPLFGPDDPPLEHFCSLRAAFALPLDETQVDSSGELAVDFDFGTPLHEEATWSVTLVTGKDTESPTPVDVSDRFSVSGGRATGSVAGADLVPGLNELIVAIDYEGDGEVDETVRSTVSYEPELDDAIAGRCDLLDTRLCLLPFPNDHFTREDVTTDTGLRVDIAMESTPENRLGVHVDPSAFNENDGFSVGPMILTLVAGVDLELSGAAPITDMRSSVTESDSPIVLVDATSGERVPIWVEADARDHAKKKRDKLLIIRPGINLKDGNRYVVAMRGLRDSNDAPIEAGRAFQLYRDAIPTFIDDFETRRPAMESIFTTLEDAGIAREELFLAWDFTVQSTRSISERLLHMRDDAFENLGSDAPAFTIDSVSEFTKEQNSRTFREINGHFEVPLYLSGDGSEGSLLTRQEGSLLPFQNGSFQAEFRCNVPHSVVDDEGDVHAARLSLYGHGLLGSQREVTSSHVDEMANAHNFVFCATKWIGMGEEDVDIIIDEVITDFSAFPKLPERLHQAMLNFLFLGRLMIHDEGFTASPDFQVLVEGIPTSLLDTSDLFYDGNSQGGIAAGALAAIAQDIERFVLGVPGMNYSTLLKRSVDFDPFLTLLLGTYPDPPTLNLAISMAEMLWERVEMNGHANHVTADPYPDTPPKKILFQVAYADHQVADFTAEIAARTVGASLRTPSIVAEKVEDAEPFWGIPSIESYPFDGSALVIWDAANPPPPLKNTPPRPDPEDFAFGPCALDHDLDPHECPRRQPEAKLQKSLFLRSDGAVHDTCPSEQVCTALGTGP